MSETQQTASGPNWGAYSAIGSKFLTIVGTAAFVGGMATEHPLGIPVGAVGAALALGSAIYNNCLQQSPERENFGEGKGPPTDKTVVAPQQPVAVDGPGDNSVSKQPSGVTGTPAPPQGKNKKWTLRELNELRTEIRKLTAFDKDEKKCRGFIDRTYQAESPSGNAASEALNSVEREFQEYRDWFKSEFESEIEARDDCNVLLTAVDDLTEKLREEKGAFGFIKEKDIIADQGFVASEIKDKHFVSARRMLSGLERRLQIALKRAERANLDQEDKKNLSEQERKQRKQEIEQYEQEIEDDRQARQAMTPQSLDLISRDHEFRTWYDKAGALYANGLVTVTAEKPKPLGQTGNLFEVKVLVKWGKRTTRSFVVHYHVDAAKETMEHINSSQMHAKPRPGDKTTARVYQRDMGWLLGIVPGLRQMRDFAKQMAKPDDA